MTARTVEYRCQIMQSGSATVVDFTLHHIAQPPTINSPAVDLLRGRTESNSTDVMVTDVADQLTSQLADANGRMQLLLRVCALQERVHQGTWTTIYSGRLAAIREAGTARVYRLRIEDERHMERGVRVFDTTDTIRLYPTGPVYRYNGKSAAQDSESFVSDVGTSPLRYVVLRCTFAQSSDVALRYMIDDLSEEYNVFGPGGSQRVRRFSTLRCFVAGAEREILAFDDPPASLYGSIRTQVADLERMLQEDEWRNRLITVVLSSEQYSVGGDDWSIALPTEGDIFTDLHIFATPMPTTPRTPMHLGVQDPSHAYGVAVGVAGIHPFTLARRIYTANNIAFDTAAMQSLEDDPFYGLVRYRVTKGQTLSKWMDENIYAPNMVVPFINLETGEIAPRSVRLPDASTFTLSDLFDFTPHVLQMQPEFRHTSADIVNRLVFEYRTEQVTNQQFRKDNPDYDLDRIEVSDREYAVDHDNQSTFGVKERKLGMHGRHSRSSIATFGATIANERFARYGDGAVLGSFTAALSARVVQAGDFATISLDSFPNAALNGRGGSRVIQLLRKNKHPHNYSFEYIDAGPALQPLSTPVVAATANANDPKYAIDVQVSSIAIGDTIFLEYAVGSVEPAATSTDWTMVGAPVVAIASTHDYVIAPLPSGSTIWTRARIGRLGRVRSLWSTASSQATTAMVAPSALTANVLNGRDVDVSWTNGEASQRIETLIDTQAIGPATPVVFGQPLAAGTTTLPLRGLDVNQVHTFEVRHVDPQGGVSAGVKVEFTTSAVQPVAPDMKFLAVLLGGLP